jgi:hypothetical protein
VAIVSLYALYVAAVNIVYSTPLFAKIIAAGDPETVFVSYEKAWSVWPGRTHTRGLVIRSSDSHVQWILRTDACVFDVSIPDLLRKKLHFTWAHGRGVSLQIRRRVPAPAATPEYVDSLPPVAGFPRIPLLKQEPPDLLEKWNDAYYHLWTIQLDDIHADDVRELWMDSVRYEGNVDVVGGFFLQPIRKVVIGPITSSIRNGRVTVLGRSVFDGMQGTATLRIDDFDPRTTGAAAFLHLLSASTELHGHTPDLANVPSSIVSPARLSGSAEVRRLHVLIDHGVLGPDTRADVFLPRASVELAAHKIEGALLADAGIVREDGRPRLRFRMDGRDVNAWPTRPHDARVDLFRVPAFDVDGDATALDLTDLLRDLHLVATVPGIDVDDLRSAGGYLPRGAVVEPVGGRAHGHARVEAWVDQARAKGEATLETFGTDVRWGQRRFRGNFGLDATVDAWLWHEDRVEGFTAKLRLPDATMSRDVSPDTALFELRSTILVAEGSELDLDDPLSDLHGRIDVSGAELIDRGLLRALPWSLQRGAQGGLDHGRAVVNAAVVFDVVDRHARGKVDLRAQRFGLWLGDVAMSAAGEAHAAVHDWDLDGGSLVLDQGKIDVTAFAARDSRDGTSLLALEALRVTLESERLRIADPFGNLRVDAAIVGGRTRGPSRVVALLVPGSAVNVTAPRGEASFEASVHAVVAGRVARGRADAHAQGIGVRTAALALRGSLEGDAHVAAWRLDDKTLHLVRGHVALTDLEGRVGAAVAERDSAADLRADRIELTANADLFDLGHPSLRRVTGRLKVEGATLDDARRLAALGSTKQGTFGVDSGRAQVSADLSVDGPAGKANGSLDVAFQDAGVRVDQAHLHGEGVLKIALKGYDPDRDQLDLAGSTLALRDVATIGAKARTTSWNGDASLLEGAVRVTEQPTFGGFVQIHADNAKPILAITLQNHLPKFLVGLLGAPDLSGQARVDLGGGVVAIREAHVRGSDVVVVGDYVTRGDHVRAAAIVSKGPLSAGIKIDDRGTFVRLLRLESWLAGETAAANHLFEGAPAASVAQPPPGPRPDH